MPRLNRTLVEALTPPPRGELVVMDTEVPSFGVRVMPSGVRSYFVRYRIGGGRTAPLRRETLGRHPVMTPEKARSAARDILAQARLGDDPTKEKMRRRMSLTVAELVDEWLAGPGKRTRKGRTKSEASFASDKGRLRHHVVPTIGRVKLCDLARSHVEQVRDAVAAGKTAQPRTRTKSRGVCHVRGGEGVAARTVAGLSTVLGYAVERGYLTANPALGVHKPREKRCERFLSPDEIERLRKALDEVKVVHPKAARILLLLMLTGCRFNEIARLTWDEVNVDAGLIRLRDSKTGARIVYLSDAAKAVCREVEVVEGAPFVFPSGDGRSHYQGTPRVWRTVLSNAGLKGVRIHDLRHTFASTALAHGASLEMIAKLLGHSELRTTARYAHLADEAVREAANKVGKAVSGANHRR